MTKAGRVLIVEWGFHVKPQQEILNKISRKRKYNLLKKLSLLHFINIVLFGPFTIELLGLKNVIKI